MQFLGVSLFAFYYLDALIGWSVAALIWIVFCRNRQGAGETGRIEINRIEILLHYIKNLLI